MPHIVEGAGITHGDDEYVVGKQIGFGGFGFVFAAERVVINKTPCVFPVPVVVKVPKPAVLADPDLVQKFSREARILANIEHPHVVKIIAFWEFEDNGEKAIVQEAVPDPRRLDQYVAAHPDHAPSLFLQALSGLVAFHVGSAPAIVHRDITPNNLLVGPDGALKIIDFGMAKEDPRTTATLTRMNIGMGTAGCIAPEQMRDAAHVDHRADLYGLGRSFAAAVQGRDPQHVDCSKLPEPWKSICTNLTEHEPHERYESALFATGEAMLLFAQCGSPIARFDLIAAEMGKRSGLLPGWPELCASHFGATPVGASELRLIARLDRQVFESPAFAVRDFFDHMEESPAIDDISRGVTSFESADPLGAVYEQIYEFLTPTQKCACLRRMARAAVNQHRYSVMDRVRDVFRKETDDDLRALLASELEAADDLRVIEGRGVIPGRP